MAHFTVKSAQGLIYFVGIQFVGIGGVNILGY